VGLVMDTSELVRGLKAVITLQHSHETDDGIRVAACATIEIWVQKYFWREKSN
jgi:hypothetical protein